MMDTTPWFDGPDGWRLAPEGVAVHPRAKTAVIADVHLGYEWARGNSGDCVPAHSLTETIAKLAPVLDRIAIDRLVVAGDLVETRRFCRRTLADVAAFARWVESRGVSLVSLAGNHDPVRRPPDPDMIVVEGWTIAHGHKPVTKASRSITGHLHPMLRAVGVAAPCFLVGPRSIVLPAFSPNAAGVHVEMLKIESTDGEPVRCVASAGGELFDFGSVADLVRALR